MKGGCRWWLLTAMVLALALAGCYNSAIVLDETARGMVGARSEGQYVLEKVVVDTPLLTRGSMQVGSSITPAAKEEGGKSSAFSEAGLLAEWLIAGSPCAESFRPAEDRARKSVPARVRVVGREKDTAGLLAGMNNILSWGTLNIWPRYSAKTYTYDVVVTIGDVPESRRYSFEQRNLSSFLPLGMFPVPAFADFRGSLAEDEDRVERRMMRDAVASLFTEEAYGRALQRSAAREKTAGGAK